MMALATVRSKTVALLSLTHNLLPLQLFYLSFVVYNAVFSLVIILCLCTVGCSTGCTLVVASVFVVLLCRDLTTTESRVKVWHL